MDIKKSIIISYQESTEDDRYHLERLLNYLNWVLDNYTEVILVEQGIESKINWLDKIRYFNQINHIFIESTTFNKGWGYNVGVVNSKSNKIILHDIHSYTKIPNYNFCANQLNDFDVVKPYKVEYDLTEELTEKFYKFNYNFNILNQKKEISYISNGVLMINKNKYLEIKGFDETIDCFHYQMESFDLKMKKFNYKFNYINCFCINTFFKKEEIIDNDKYLLYLYNDMDNDYFREILNNIDIGLTDKNVFDYDEFILPKPISILVTAHNVKDYIEECLDSIENQDYFKLNDEFEILLGIDHCQETLDKVLSIKHKYRNLHVFMMDSNKGTYITTNTLLDIAKYDNLLRFDSDDIMMPNMISEIMKYVNNYNVISFGFVNIINGKYKKLNQAFARGILFYKKVLIDDLGGYQPWICSADTELLKRGESLINMKIINKDLFYYRKHDDSLTIVHGENSDMRDYYQNLIGKHESVKIERMTNDFSTIGDGFKIEKSNIKRNTKKQFSIVVPTMWVSDKFEKMLEIYETTKAVKEVIIIDNNPDYKNINLKNYKKVIYYTENKNLFVNPSWNKGYSLSNYELILANDDILIDNLDDVLMLISMSDYDIIGIDLKSDRLGLRINDIIDFPFNSYGCFMYIRKYTYIPEQIKIWRGDYHLFNNSNKKGIIRNIDIKLDISKTLNSDINLKNITKIDKNNYNDLCSYNDNDINVLIRTSGRPNFFSNCVDSVKKYLPNAKLHITIDDLKDLEYVEEKLKGFNYNYYLIDRNTVSGICKKIKIERSLFIYNYYFNVIKPFLNGWCLILDDDDEILMTPKFEDNTNNIYLYRVDVGNRIVPHDSLFGKEPKLNQISSLCIVFHSSQMIDWVPHRGGDYSFISSLYKKYNTIWNYSIISKSQTGGNWGRRNDLIKKNI